MRLQAVYDRLTERFVNIAEVFYASAGQEEGMTEIIGHVHDMPRLILFPVVETAEDNVVSSAEVVQQFTQRIVLHIYVLEQPINLLENIRIKLKEALVGFKPDDNWRPIIYEAGDIEAIRGELIIYSDTFLSRASLQYLRS